MNTGNNSLVASTLITTFIAGSVAGPTVERVQGTSAANKYPRGKFACVTTVTSTKIAPESCRNAQMVCAIAYDHTPTGRPAPLRRK